MKNRLKYSLLLCSLTLSADELSISFYNDFFAGSDKQFTNGMAFYWLDDNKKESSYTKFILNNINLDTNKNYNAGLSIRQVITTPSNKNFTTPQYDDMPYAGYLSLATYLLQYDSESFNEYSLELGVTGRASLGGFIQRNFHKLIGDTQPKGWDTQLKTEYIVNLLIQRGDKTWQKQIKKDLSADWFNNFGFTLGNFKTSAFISSIFRIGHNYDNNFNTHYPYLKEEASLIKIKEHKGFGWSVSSGINTELLAYSYILDEGYNSGYNTDKKLVNGSLYLGGSLYFDEQKVSLFYEAQSSYIKNSNSFDVFGGILYSYRF